MKEIDYQFRECLVACDFCEKERTVESTDYTEINKDLKNYGWLVRKIGDEWFEFCCEKCYKAFLKGIKDENKMRN